MFVSLKFQWSVCHDDAFSERLKLCDFCSFCMHCHPDRCYIAVVVCQEGNLVT
jgi:hypothetical protein